MKYKKYFEDHEYNAPMLIELEEPQTVALCKLREFLDSFKPFECSTVYQVERFEYGAFNNYVNAAVESKTIETKYSHTYDLTNSYCIATRFWSLHKDREYPFWKYCPQVGYGENIHASNMENIYVEVKAVYVIADYDKERIEREDK